MANKKISDARQALESEDFANAALILDKLIDEDMDVEAMYLRAQLSTLDESDEISNARRIKLLTRAASLNHADAIYELSIHYDIGDLVKQDITHSAELLDLAAQHRHPHAIWRVGIKLIYSQPISNENLQAGLALIEQAAELGSQGAILSLAGFYSKGEFGFSQNVEKAKELYILAESENVKQI